MGMIWVEPWLEPLVYELSKNPVAGETIVRAIKLVLLDQVKAGLETAGYSDDKVTEIIVDLRNRAFGMTPRQPDATGGKHD